MPQSLYQFGGLDQAVTRLQAVIDNGRGLYGAIPRVAQELRAASDVMGIHVASAPRHLQRPHDQSPPVVRAARRRLVHRSEPVSARHCENRSGHPVIVKFDGEGRATGEFGDDMTIGWGRYTDSRMRVPAGTSKSLDLGDDTGETLYVGEGQKVLLAKMRADVSSDDGAIADCRLNVARALPPVSRLRSRRANALALWPHAEGVMNRLPCLGRDTRGPGC